MDLPAIERNLANSYHVNLQTRGIEISCRIPSQGCKELARVSRIATLVFGNKERSILISIESPLGESINQNSIR